MSGLDKIVQQIQDEARQAASETVDKAKAEAMAITSKAGVDAAARRESIRSQADSDVKNVLSAAESAAQLAKRRALLSAKQEIIGKLIAETQKDFYALPDDEYFALILIIFSKKDLDRLPKGFAGKISSSAKGELELSKETRPIDGGFVLSYGGIEENCSVEALFYAAREQLQDKVSGILFS